MPSVPPPAARAAVRRRPAVRRAAALACALAAGAAASASAAQFADSAMAMHTPETFDRALAAARAQRQLVLVYVSSRDCFWCRDFESTHLADPAFIVWTRALFQTVKVDGDSPRHLEWLKGRGIAAEVFPTYFLLDAQGRRLAMSTRSARFAPLKAVQLFEQVKGRRFDFDPARLAEAARELSRLRYAARPPERRLAYGAMEALTWHWLGRPQNALAAFGPEAAALLAQGPADRREIEKWDEIRLWYAGFWSSYGEANFPAAYDVAVKGYQERRLAQYLWWAAFLAEQMGRFDLAARHGEDYAKAANLPRQHPFRPRLEQWKRQAAAAHPAAEPPRRR